MDPRAQQKTMLKNIAQKIEMTPNALPQNQFILGVAPPGAPVGPGETLKANKRQSQYAAPAADGRGALATGPATGKPTAEGD